MSKLILEYSETPISRAEVDSFMKEFNLVLPQDYIDFMIKNNGGDPNLSAFGNPYEDGAVIETFYFISLNEAYEYLNKYSNPVRDIIKTYKIYEQNIPDYLYPFGCDAGGANFCLSMRKKDFGAVYLFYVDYTSDEPFYLCKSFKEFIEGLEDLEIYEYD